MIDDLLRPTGPGPRPPADGFVQALRAGRRKRWRTLRTNLACGTAALAAVVTAMVPRLSITSFAGLEPTHPVIGTHQPPGPSAPVALTPSATPHHEPSDPAVVDDRPGYEPAGPAGYAPPGYAPAASRGPAGPRAEGSSQPAPPAQPAGTDGEPAPAPSPYEPPPTTQPEPPASPTPDPPGDPGPEPIDLTFENQSTTDPCDSTTWCWSAEVVDTYTLRLLACRGATGGELRFDKENEADFRVLRDGAEVWRWSIGQPDPAWSHPVYVDQWECAVWSTRWYGFDQSGAAVAAGAYRLEATSRTWSVPAKWWSASFSVT